MTCQSSVEPECSKGSAASRGWWDSEFAEARGDTKAPSSDTAGEFSFGTRVAGPETLAPGGAKRNPGFDAKSETSPRSGRQIWSIFVVPNLNRAGYFCRRLRRLVSKGHS